MKKLRLSLSFMLALFLIFASSTSVFASKNKSIMYTALGDSITVGIGATQVVVSDEESYFNGYNQLLYKYFLENYDQVGYQNIGFSGITSAFLTQDLQNLLAMNPVYSELATSDIITINIGGNDLLYPFLNLVREILEADYLNENWGYDMDKFMVDFNAWKEDPGNPEYAKFNVLLTSSSAEWDTVTTDFSGNWISIISTLREIDLLDSESAVIYVNTIYNPFTDDPMLHDIVDGYIIAMNEIIISNAKAYNYKVANVYNAFEKYGNSKKTLPPIVGDLSNFGAIFTNYDYFTPFPLHPTNLGYKIIFDLHMDLMK